MAESEEKRPLSNKQRRFCEEYIIDWNATRAAISAGYSEKTAYSVGSENLRKPELKEYIEEIQKHLAKQAGISALSNMLELKKIAYANISAFAKGWSDLEEWEKIPDDDKAALSEVIFEETADKNGNKTVKVRYKLHDKQKAITILNQMNGWNASEKVDHTTNGKSIRPRIIFKDGRKRE